MTTLGLTIIYATGLYRRYDGLRYSGIRSDYSLHAQAISSPRKRCIGRRNDPYQSVYGALKAGRSSEHFYTKKRFNKMLGTILCPSAVSKLNEEQQSHSIRPRSHLEHFPSRSRTRSRSIGSPLTSTITSTTDGTGTKPAEGRRALKARRRALSAA